MTRMTRWTRIIALATLVAFVSACATTQAWWQRVQADPVTEMQRDISYIQNALALADGAFAIFRAASPALAVQAEPQYRAVVGRVRAALAVAMDALRLAAEARRPAPNADELLAQARAALHDLQALLEGLPGNGPGQAASPEMQQALHALVQAQRPWNAAR